VPPSPLGPGSVTLTARGKEHLGWKRGTITRSMESIAGSFDLEINTRWAGSTQELLIFEEDECVISVFGSPVITGFVDKRSVSHDAKSKSFKVSGRDAAGALVDCSAVVPKLVYNQTPVLDLVTKICEPHGITASLPPGLTVKLPPRDKLAVNPGDTAHSVIEKICRMTGLLPISDSQGGLLLTQAGTARISTKLQCLAPAPGQLPPVGNNILKASAEFDYKGRFAEYRCLAANAAKVPKKNNAAAAKSTAKATVAARKARGIAFDEIVQRKARILIINPEDGADKKYADQRAQWEATTRAAKSEVVHVTVRGWQQDDGQLWTNALNSLVGIEDSELDIKGDMLIVEVKLDLGSVTSELKLMDPAAFTPEPRIKRKVGNTWNELSGVR
jgi:prophage tail gpP-like protein